jgi:hypothetical protein
MHHRAFSTKWLAAIVSSTISGVFSGEMMPLITTSQRHSSMSNTSIVAATTPSPNHATTIGSANRKAA